MVSQFLSLILATAVLLAHGPLLKVYFERLWELEHYQFVPLLLLGVIGLTISRWRSLHVKLPTDGRIPLRSAIVAVSLLALATLMCSPWLATLSFVVSCGLFLKYATGSQWRSFLPIWALLFLIIRPPLGLDVQLIQRLQVETSRFAGMVLEGLGIAHVLNGNVLSVPGREFLVEEACSGIHSLFALVTAAAFYAAVMRIPLVRAVPLILSAMLWACFANLIRIVVIVVADATNGIDLTEGTPHEVLGGVTFFLGVLFLVLTDQLLRFVLDPIRSKEAGSETAMKHNVFARAWNYVVQAPLAVAKDTASADEITVTSAGTTRMLATGSLVCLGIVLALWQVKALRADQMPDVVTSAAFDHIDKSDLPETVGQWRLADYQVERRRDDPTQSEFSKIWLYATPKNPVAIAIDYPFRGWHDLTNCYVGRGWTVVKARGEVVRDPENNQEMFVTEAILRQESGQYALLLFTGFDDQGRHLTNPGVTSWWKEASWSLFRRLTMPLADASVGLSPEWRVTTQFQLFTKIDADQPTEATRAEAYERFAKLCETLKARLQQQQRTDES